MKIEPGQQFELKNIYGYEGSVYVVTDIIKDFIKIQLYEKDGRKIIAKEQRPVMLKSSNKIFDKKNLVRYRIK